MKTLRITTTFKSCEFKLYKSTVNNRGKKQRITEATKISPSRPSSGNFSQKARENSSLFFFFAVLFIIIDMFSALAISANFRPNTPFNFIDHIFHMASRRPCLCTKKNPVGIELFSHVKTFFYSKQFAKLLTT